MFHARDLMPFFPATINANRAPRHRLSHDSNRGHVAPLADLLVVQAVDGLVFPDRADPGGGYGGSVGEEFNARSAQQR
jgi:hypothetical protein